MIHSRTTATGTNLCWTKLTHGYSIITPEFSIRTENAIPTETTYTADKALSESSFLLSVIPRYRKIPAVKILTRFEM